MGSNHSRSRNSTLCALNQFDSGAKTTLYDQMTVGVMQQCLLFCVRVDRIFSFALSFGGWPCAATPSTQPSNQTNKQTKIFWTKITTASNCTKRARRRRKRRRSRKERKKPWNKTLKLMHILNAMVICQDLQRRVNLPYSLLHFVIFLWCCGHNTATHKQTQCTLQIADRPQTRGHSSQEKCLVWRALRRCI